MLQIFRKLMPVLYNKNDLKAALESEIVYLDNDYNYQIEHVVFDNREAKENTLFIARKGERTDGHRFIADALKLRNDIVVLAERLPEDIEKNSRIILVKSTDRAFEKLAIFARNRLKCPAIGITGSIGKTGTKDLFYNCLSKFGKSHCNEQSFNNYTGVLVTLANTPADTQYPIYEMGMNAKGEMDIIEGFIKPEISIILNVKQAHFGCFSSEEEIAIEKSKIMGESTKVVVLNKDNKWYEFLHKIASEKNIKIISFGVETRDTEVSLLEHKVDCNKALVKYLVYGKTYEKVFKNIDYNLAYNAQALLCVAQYLGLSIDKILDAVADTDTTRGRNNIEYASYQKDGKNINLTIINGAYNAVNPDVFVSGLRLIDNVYKQGKNKRKVCIWGDILEAGSKSQEFHIGLGKHLVDSKIDLLLTVGQYMNQLSDALEDSAITRVKFDAIEDMIANVKSYLEDGDLVFIKSSKGIKTYKVLNSLVKNEMKLFV